MWLPRRKSRSYSYSYSSSCPLSTRPKVMKITIKIKIMSMSMSKKEISRAAISTVPGHSLPPSPVPRFSREKGQPENQAPHCPCCKCRGLCRQEERANHPDSSGVSLFPPIVRLCPKGHRESPPSSDGNETCALRPVAIGRERTSNWCRAPCLVCNASSGFCREVSRLRFRRRKQNASLKAIAQP